MGLLTRELLSRLETIHIASKRRLRLQHRGEQTSLRKGASLEFSDYREYLQGDDIRTVDWNVYARTEKLFLKLFLEEESRPVYFLVDASESMNFGEPSKLQYALAFSTGLSYSALRHYDKPVLFLFSDDRLQKFTFRSRHRFFSLLQGLENQRGTGTTNISRCLKRFSLMNPPRGSCFVVSDFYSEDGFTGIKILAAAGFEVNCLHVLAPSEVNPELLGDLKLIDCEANDSSAEVSISPGVLRNYRRRLVQFQNQIKNTAHASACTYSFVDTSIPLAELIFDRLRKNGLLV
jgi:uncharacterized protein (DUF58 family)